jgi:hypothetical protein
MLFTIEPQETQITKGESDVIAKIRYPESCLYEFVGHKLERLASWGYVYHDRINGTWYIVDQNQNKIMQ